MSWSGRGGGNDGYVYSAGSIDESSRPRNSPRLLQCDCDDGRCHNHQDESFPAGEEEVCFDRCPAKPMRGTSARTTNYRTLSATEVDFEQADELRKCLAKVTVSQHSSAERNVKPVHSFVLPPRFPVRKASKGYAPAKEEPRVVNSVEDGDFDDVRGSSLGTVYPNRSRGFPPGEMCSAPSELLIQVAPGVRVPLRSGAETWQAIVDDFYVPSSCLGCSGTLFVIQDAAYVLCPSCRTISPMAGQFINRFVAGAGLGFTFEDLTRWQRDIQREQTGR